MGSKLYDLYKFIKLGTSTYHHPVLSACCFPSVYLIVVVSLFYHLSLLLCLASSLLGLFADPLFLALLGFVPPILHDLFGKFYQLRLAADIGFYHGRLLSASFIVRRPWLPSSVASIGFAWLLLADTLRFFWRIQSSLLHTLGWLHLGRFLCVPK